MAASDLCINPRLLKIVSFNMHGYNQGFSAINEMISTTNPDVFLCQEHWLTPANLHKFQDDFRNYLPFGSTAMSNQVEAGILKGRPFGGLMTLIKNDLRSLLKTVHSDDRFVIVKLANYLLINVYLPCVGTKDRLLICENIFENLWSWREHYPDCECIIAGDFNADLNGCVDDVAQYVNSFISSYGLSRCDSLTPYQGQPTYVNFALNHQSCIDFVLTSNTEKSLHFEILDPNTNFSDHLPIAVSLVCHISTECKKSNAVKDNLSPTQLYLRWDKADNNSYYFYTGQCLQPVLYQLENLLEVPETNCTQDLIDALYNEIIVALNTGANLYVPSRHKHFYKFWWDEEMNVLKEAAINSNKIWKAAGKPRQGPIFNKRQLCKAQYRKGLREKQKLNTSRYTNDLHEALISKNGPTFWKCWRSKFDTRPNCTQVDGFVDPYTVANNFARYFSDIYSPNNSQHASSLHKEYLSLRQNYFGFPLAADFTFNTELVSKVMSDLKCGKAPDINGLTAEHLLRAHPILPLILNKFFQLILKCKLVPTGFGYSYIVPLPKSNASISKVLTCEDFRGIAISPVISKLFEYCFVEKFGEFLSTDNKQFGFKKGLGCNHAIYTVRRIVDRFIKGGNTVNLCAIDLSKAFDKVNHHALFIKLMKRNLPVALLDILENWLKNCFSSVKWNNLFSDIFAIKFGVRQGSVLSPFLFAIYLDDIPITRSLTPRSFIILYADDILLIAPSISELQRIFNNCERELEWLDMRINVKKIPLLANWS